ncbi:MAG: hypothetical protein M3N47_08785 [Chloroflexota bacterium]|nr:hypothetical protein [Chloroflexota bacterium]
MWSVLGASGSSNIAPDGGHAHRVVGVTSRGGGGVGRVVVDADEFLREYDNDRNSVLDAIDYDWLITAPILDFHLLLFDTPFRLSRWVAVPGGSGTSVGDRVGALTGVPRMTGSPDKTDGFWHNFARFRPNQVYALSIAALGSQLGIEDGSIPGQGSYVRFLSDATGHEVRYRFFPRAQAARFVGRVMLAGNSDYRLILGTDPGTALEVQSLAIIAEGRRFGFETHDERRSWEFSGGSRPTSWGTFGSESFAGAVVGPSTGGWSLRNRFLGLLPASAYRVRFDTLAVQGVGAARSCFARIQDLGGNVSGEHRWDFAPGSGRRSEEFVFNTGDGPAKTLVFGVDHDAVYLIGDLHIEFAPV